MFMILICFCFTIQLCRHRRQRQPIRMTHPILNRPATKSMCVRMHVDAKSEQLQQQTVMVHR